MRHINRGPSPIVRWLTIGHWIWLVTGLGLSIILVAFQAAAAGGPWYVAPSPSGNDGNDCLSPETACASINAAIGKASGGDTIRIAEGIYLGTGSEVVLIDKDISLEGGWDPEFASESSWSTIDGAGMRRGFHVNVGVSASIDRFAIQNSSFTGDGGAIRNEGNLAISDGRIQGNTSGAGSGGALFNSATGTLDVSSSEISGNGSNDLCLGSALMNEGTASIRTSLITGNMSTTIYCVGATIFNTSELALIDTSVSDNSPGPGILNFGHLALYGSTVNGNQAKDWTAGGVTNWGGTVTVLNSTISSNYGVGVLNGNNGLITVRNGTVAFNTQVGIDNQSGSFTLVNTILAGNSASAPRECSGVLSSAGHNLVRVDTGCSFIAAIGDIIGSAIAPVDPLLGPLQNNGGPTATHELFDGSLAIDGGSLATISSGGGACLAFDQRGAPRPVDGDGNGFATCDIGAYEAGGVPGSVVDTDNDGVADHLDNCPAIANSTQLDADMDGLGNPCDPDGDNDGLTDLEEVGYGTDPLDPDSDNDGLTDGSEVTVHGTDPLRSDTDSDGLSDGEEVAVGTNPFDPDSDDDFLSDREEVFLGTDPLDADSDDDGLPDESEVRGYFSDPLNPDTDSDSFLDGADNCPVASNLDQLDTESDGLGDMCDDDDDNDGLPDGQEVALGTDPLNADSDADGLTDSEEVNVYGTDPLNRDTDSDTFLDGGDNCPRDFSKDQGDLDADGIGDVCDLEKIVRIDIMPGRRVNRIELETDDGGECDDSDLQVAILTTRRFNTVIVDVSTVQLRDPALGGTAAPLRSRVRDVDRDGDKDLLLTFSVCDLLANSALDVNTTELLLYAITVDGIPIIGSDSVKVVADDK